MALGIGAGCVGGLLAFASTRVICTPGDSYKIAQKLFLAKSCVQSWKDRLWGRDGEANRILEAQGVLFRREWNMELQTTIELEFQEIPYRALMETVLGGALIGWLHYTVSPLGAAWGTALALIDSGRKAYRAVVWLNPPIYFV